MNYIELTINGETYKLRLNTRNIVALEKALGHNPLGILFQLNLGEVPTATEIITIFHYMLQQYQHGIKMDETYDIYDEYLAEGHTIFTFISDVIVPVFKSCGLLADEDKEKN